MESFHWKDQWQKKMSKAISNYIIELDYADRTLLVLSGATSGVCLSLFIYYCCRMNVGIAKAIISLVHFAGNGILKMYLKTTGRRKSKPRKVVLLARSNLKYRRKNKIQDVGWCWDLSWRFILVSNKRESYGRLKDGIRTKDSQRGDIERYKSMEHDKRISANEILRQNESWSLELKTKVENLLIL